MGISRKAFHGLIKQLGYSKSEAAAALGISPSRLSQIANDPGRPVHYELALWALPPKDQAQPFAERREAVAALAERGVRVRRRYARKPHNDAPTVRDMSTWWEGHLLPGSVVVCSKEQGPHLPEGCKGLVLQVDLPGGRFCAAFPTGYVEWLDIELLENDTWIAETGQSAPLPQGPFLSAEAAAVAIANGDVKLQIPE